MSRRLLKQAGIDDREMTLRVIGNTPERLAALRTGVVDATTLTLPADFQAEKVGLRRLVFVGDVLESVSGGIGVSENWLRERPERIKKMIKAVFKAMAHAKAHRQEMISLVMLRWKLERDIADKVFDLTVKTWSEQGVASDSSVLLSIQENLAISREQKEVPISQVVDFRLARQVFRELTHK